MLVSQSFFAMLAVSAALVAAPPALGQTRQAGSAVVSAKIHPRILERAQSESIIPVFIVLEHQPQRELIERAESANAVYRQVAESRYRQAAERPAPNAEELSQARQEAEAVLLRTRQQAFQSIDQAIGPEQAALESRLKGLGATRISRYHGINMLTAEIPASAIAALEADPAIAQVFPVDKQFAQLATSVPALGAPAFWNAGYTGQGESVAILDTGVAVGHPAFAGVNIVSQVFLANGSTDSCFEDNSASVLDRQGHGSHVAGIVASQGSAGWTAYRGVARGLGTLYNLKTAYLSATTPDCSPGGAESDPRDVLAALDWAVANTPLKIFNYSYGSAATLDDDPWAQTLDQYIDNYGLIFAIAAGNGGSTNQTVSTPAIGYNGIAVANWVSRGNIASSSSCGPTAEGRDKPDLAAPGTNIFSVNYNWTAIPGTGDDFISETGTSMATPHIAGSAALLESAGVTDSLAVKAVLINTADPVSGWDPQQAWTPCAGWGYTNLATALGQLYYQTDSLATGDGRLYRMPSAAANTRVTLTWNRHIVSSTPEFNNLTVSLYSEDTGAVLSGPPSPVASSQNVQQASAAQPANVVVRVAAASEIQGVASEPFAVALSQPATPVAGYQIAASCSLPSSVLTGAQFTAVCTMSNTGDLTAPGAMAQVTLPLGFSGNVQSLAVPAPPASTTNLVLNLTAPASPGTYSVGWNVGAPSSFGLAAYTATGNALIAVQPALPAPVLLSPANGALGVSQTPSLTWTASPGAVAYDVYLGTSWPLLFAATTTAPNYTPTTLATTGLFFWQVVARNGNGASASTVSSFTVQAGSAGQLGNIVITVAGNGLEEFGGDGPATSTAIWEPMGIGLDAAKNLYFAQNGSVLSKLTPADGMLRTYAQLPSNGNWNLAVEPAGNVYAGLWLSVYKITPDQKVTLVAGNGTFGYSGDGGQATSAEFSQVSGLALDAAGNLYISDYYNWVVRKVTPNGIISTVAGNGTQDNSGSTGDGGPAVDAQLDGPQALAVDAAGNLYIGEALDFRVRKMGPDGVINAFARANSGSLATDLAGNVYVGDNSARMVFKVTPDGTVTPFAGNGNWVSSGDGGPALAASFGAMNGLALDSSGTVYVSDLDRVRAVVPADPSCRYAVDVSAVAAASGGTLPISVQTGPSCWWAAAGLPSWIVGPASGKGAGSTGLAALANPGPARSATIAIGGVALTVSQGDSTCNYALNSGAMAVPAGGFSGPLAITTAPNCPWSVSAPPDWLTFSGPTSGVGSGSVNYTVAPDTGDPRAATLAVADQTFTVQQVGIWGPGLRFTPVIPCRLADTRYTSVIAGGTSRDFAVPQLGCGIPATAQAYSLNVTVVPKGYLGYLTIWPTGQVRPNASTLNSWDGIVVANAAIVPAGANGAVSVYVSNDSDVILDINGDFDTSTGPTSYSFYPVTPCRVADTRGTAGPFGKPSLSGGQGRDFPLPSSSCGLPSSASAYSMNVTVVPSGYLGYLTAWPTGQSQPNVSTLNSWTGKVVANAALVPAGAGGSISVFAEDATDVILDTNGYFGLPGGGALNFYPVAPCRVADTRGGEGPFGGPEMEAATTRSFAIPAGGCNIPATAAAYSLNVTVVPGGLLSYLTAWPTGSPQPMVSTLNSFDGAVVANAAIVPAGPDGGINIYVTDPTQVILDINGYFAP